MPRNLTLLTAVGQFDAGATLSVEEAEGLGWDLNHLAKAGAVSGLDETPETPETPETIQARIAELESEIEELRARLEEYEGKETDEITSFEEAMRLKKREIEMIVKQHVPDFTPSDKDTKETLARLLFPA